MERSPPEKVNTTGGLPDASNTRKDSASLVHDSRQPLSILEEELGPLTQAHQKVAQVLELVRIEEFVPSQKGLPHRPADERGCIARAFVAKAVLNLATTRLLLDRLAPDAVLRRLTSCLDFRFWIPLRARTIQNPKSKIQNKETT